MKSVHSALRPITLRVRGEVPLRLSNPVLVYQMGKVASSSVYEALRRAPGVDVFHVHRLNPENIRWVRDYRARRGAKPANEDLDLYLFEKLVRPRRKPLKIISLVREPIGRNISAYFQNRGVFESTDTDDRLLDLDQLIASFLRNYPHEVPLSWFDVELKATMGIDVYQHDFPREQGYQIIRERPYELLLMRYDLDDLMKQDLIGDFVGLSTFSLPRVNEASVKEYSGEYARLLRSIKIPPEYAERMLSSRYALHFYPTEELSALKRRWTGVLDT